MSFDFCFRNHLYHGFVLNSKLHKIEDGERMEVEATRGTAEETAAKSTHKTNSNNFYAGSRIWDISLW